MDLCHTLYQYPNDKPYLRVGPFYFCSEECRESWMTKFAGENLLYDQVAEDPLDQTQCDNCNGLIRGFEE